MIEAELYENLSLNAKSSWVHGCLSAPKALSSSGEKSEANQERKVDMKWFGAMFFVAGIAWAYMWRHDPVEGQFMRPAGFLIAAFGFFYFFEALKNEIINALKERKDDHLKNQTRE